VKKLSTALSQDAEVEGRRLNGRTRQSQTPAYGHHLLRRCQPRHCAEPVEQLCRVGERVAQDMKLNGLLAFSI
jgi:hypothetical protein